MSSATAAQPHAVSLNEPRTSTSTASTSSTKTSYGKKHQVSSVCYPTGSKWDFLRPTTKPYQGFGSLADYTEMSGNDMRAGTEENWTHDVYHKMDLKEKKAKKQTLNPYMSR